MAGSTSVDTEAVGLYCPYAKKLNLDPVKLDPCGHIVSRKYIEEEKVTKCPVCSVSLEGYGRDYKLEKKVDTFVRSVLQLPSTLFDDFFLLAPEEHLLYLCLIYGRRCGLEVFVQRQKSYTILSNSPVITVASRICSAISGHS